MAPMTKSYLMKWNKAAYVYAHHRKTTKSILTEQPASQKQSFVWYVLLHTESQHSRLFNKQRIVEIRKKIQHQKHWRNNAEMIAKAI